MPCNDVWKKRILQKTFFSRHSPVSDIRVKPFAIPVISVYHGEYLVFQAVS